MFRTWYQLQPQWFIAMLIILMTILLLLLLDPPHSACQSQLQLLRDSQQAFLFGVKSRLSPSTPRIQESNLRCRLGNSQGACHEWFEGYRALIADLTKIPQECESEAITISAVRLALIKGLELMSQLAWGGSKPPESYLTKYNWFESPDISVFCGLKQQAQRFLGAEPANNLRETVLKGLPGASTLERTELWNRSIYSTQCEPYL